MKLSVPEMSCGHCKATVEKAVTAAGGTARVDLENRQVDIEGISPDQAIAAIREAGYESQPV